MEVESIPSLSQCFAIMHKSRPFYILILIERGTRLQFSQDIADIQFPISECMRHVIWHVRIVCMSMCCECVRNIWREISLDIIINFTVLSELTLLFCDYPAKEVRKMVNMMAKWQTLWREAYGGYEYGYMLCTTRFIERRLTIVTKCSINGNANMHCIC